MVNKISITACLLLLAGTASAIVLEGYEYNDAAGVDIKGAVNSGSLGSTWNFGTPAGEDETDGAGSLVIDGDTGTRTRKLPDDTGPNGASGDIYATPLAGTEEYTLTVDFSSWNFAAASIGDSWSYKLVDTAAKDIAKIILEVDSASSTRIRLATFADDGTSKFRNFAYGLTEIGGVLAQIKFDFDDDTVSYWMDGAETHNFGFGGTNVSQHVMVKNGDGTADWATAASSVSIDAIRLEVIPEPATLGLIMVFGTGILFVRRRFMI